MFIIRQFPPHQALTIERTSCSPRKGYLPKRKMTWIQARQTETAATIGSSSSRDLKPSVVAANSRIKSSNQFSYSLKYHLQTFY